MLSTFDSFLYYMFSEMVRAGNQCWMKGDDARMSCNRMEKEVDPTTHQSKDMMPIEFWPKGTRYLKNGKIAARVYFYLDPKYQWSE